MVRNTSSIKAVVSGGLPPFSRRGCLLMDRLEFYLYEDELWCKNGTENALVDRGSQLLDGILDIIKECYPDAYDALSKEYERSAPNRLYYRFLMVKRFLKCNFGQLDSTSYDIDDGKFNFERVECPLRGECKWDGVICSPIFKTTLSAHELHIGNMWYDGMAKEEIAGLLFISPETVNNHIRNIYRKLDIHDKAEMIKYFNEHQLYGKAKE